MPFKNSVGARVGTWAIAWLVLISVAHWLLNGDHRTRNRLVMGYMPVITNLACPLLDAASETGDGLRFEALKFASFAEMAEALRNRHIDAAFMIAPLAIVLRQQNEDVKVVYIGNRHESTLVVRSDIAAEDFGDLAGRTLAVPMRYSGHNISAHQFAEEYGRDGAAVNIVEMNPPDMAAALAAGALEAYSWASPLLPRQHPAATPGCFTMSRRCGQVSSAIWSSSDRT